MSVILHLTSDLFPGIIVTAHTVVLAGPQKYLLWVACGLWTTSLTCLLYDKRLHGSKEFPNSQMLCLLSPPISPFPWLRDRKGEEGHLWELWRTHVGSSFEQKRRDSALTGSVQHWGGGHTPRMAHPISAGCLGGLLELFLHLRRWDLFQKCPGSFCRHASLLCSLRGCGREHNCVCISGSGDLRKKLGSLYFLPPSFQGKAFTHPWAEIYPCQERLFSSIKKIIIRVWWKKQLELYQLNTRGCLRGSSWPLQQPMRQVQVVPGQGPGQL